jgi:cellulose synthase/poly-beta-1,6-N-acetylglucosamine synthase-like glycosyltransferase
MKHGIAILLPHYNNCNGLRLSLKSLMNETETFTLFVYDDGSNDFNCVEQIINEFDKYYHIVLKRNDQNLGITKTLNKALEFILKRDEYKYVARLDAGDICVNDRLKNQLRTFESDKELMLVGSWVRFVDAYRKQLYVFKPPSNYDDLKKIIHYYNPFIHPSVMYKTEVVKKIGYYPTNYPALEDYAFFFEIIKHFKVALIEKILVNCELNPNGISTVRRREQTKSRIRLLKNKYKFGLIPTLKLIRALLTFLLPLSFLTFMKRQFVYR